MKCLKQLSILLSFILISFINSAKPVFPNISIPQRVNGEQAIQALGNTLPAIAQNYGMTTAEFAKMLRTDRTAWIDQKGRLLFIDDFPQPVSEEHQTPEYAAPFPLIDTFILHSKPGANRVIHLDFDGHMTSGTAWNGTVDPVISPPFTTDSDSTTFSNSELENIQNIWRQVAEDFAPFNVDVTTEDPGDDAIIRVNNEDTFYGTRVVFTQYDFDNCGCGGFAYVGIFNYTGSYYKPAFVFNSGVVGAGEAASHEAGHNLGLSHDGQTHGSGYYSGYGSGATGWAPIMGVGYSQPLVQWSKGEYFDASQTQDDIVLIQGHGVPLLNDDHGDSHPSASPLVIITDGITASLSGSGIIETREDFDSFSFSSGPGNFSFNAQPASFKANLDVLLELYRYDGLLIASSNPTDSLSASISGSVLTSGDYYLTISGVGKGDPETTGYSDYGSLGQYSITGSVPDASGLIPPQANILAPYTSAEAPLLINFDGRGSSDEDGNITSYVWDFGDESTASGELVSHSYQESGSFIASLTVTDNDNMSNTETVIIDVVNQAPTAKATISSYEGEAPHNINFTGSQSSDPDGSIISYLWDFGDGSSSSDADVSHEYLNAGEFNTTLTVTDNLGASHLQQSLPISITPPAFINQYAVGEIYNAGEVSGTFTALEDNDGNSQSITERESGGKKSNRFSYLEHSWLFNVQTGSAVTLYLNAWMASSSDSDEMHFDYSHGGESYTSLLTLNNSDDSQTITLPLNISSAGQVIVRVRDTDRSAGNRSLDKVFIDQLYIRTDNQQALTPPNVPSNLNVSATSSNTIELTWLDNSADELGFRLEQSMDDGINWQLLTNTSANIETYSSNNLQADTTYGYRISAFNNSGFDGYVEGFATTQVAGSIVLTGSGSKVKGKQQVSLSWTGITGVDIYKDGTFIVVDEQSPYDKNLGIRGGGSYVYKVCEQDSTTNCSNEITIIY